MCRQYLIPDSCSFSLRVSLASAAQRGVEEWSQIVFLAAADDGADDLIEIQVSKKGRLLPLESISPVSGPVKKYAVERQGTVTSWPAGRRNPCAELGEYAVDSQALSCRAQVRS